MNKSIIEKLDDSVQWFSEKAIVLGVFLMIGLSFFSIVLRWSGQSMMWIDPLVRHLVLVCAFLGASIATRKGMHIKMDVFLKFIEKLPASAQKAIKIFVNTFTFVVLIFFIKSAYDFFLMEQEFGGEAFLGISSGTMVMIIPLGMALVALRTLLLILLQLTDKVEH